MYSCLNAYKYIHFIKTLIPMLRELGLTGYIFLTVHRIVQGECQAKLIFLNKQQARIC
jgi:hypothetical protein